jgi:protein phosphatase
MLVCPNCQCKNPTNHKFCQKCGIPLTKKACPECGTQINVSDLTCHNCGAKTGKTWWGIMVPNTQPVTPEEEVRSEFPSPPVATEEPLPVEQPISEGSDSPADPETEDVLSAFNQEEVPQESEMATQIDRSEEVAGENEAELSTSTNYIDDTEDSMAGAAAIEASETLVQPQEADDVLTTETPETTEPSETITPAFASGDYLDDDRRYELIELKEEIITSGEFAGELQGSVLDRQPFQISPLLTTLSASQSTPRSGSTTIIQSAPMLPPAIAEPYLQLRSQWSPIIPLIHDAWETEDYSVVLIEERSAFPQLRDRCYQLQATESADFQQMLQWFKQMTELWQVLTPLNCGTSLLKIENLLVDPETQALRLQRLYADSADPSESPSLAELGKLWQELLPPTILSSETQEASETEEVESDESSDATLIQLVNDVIHEKILTSDGLLAKIHNIAQPPEDEDFSDDDISTVIMTQGLKSLQAVGATDVGQQRSHNEDDFAIDTQVSQRQTSEIDSTQFQGLYIVCDGMGGHDGGEVASAKAVTTLQQYFATHWPDELMLPEEASIREAVLSANQAIYDLNQEEIRSGSGRMGTTLVMALVNNHQIAIAHVGDSRVYRLTESNGLEQITVDHEVGQREIQRGIDPEMAYSRPDAYQLTQALGPRPENFVQPDIQFLSIEEDALFILASDGLTDNDLLENHLSTHLQPLLNSEADLKQGVQDLIALANDYNGHDNITAILIRALVKH